MKGFRTFLLRGNVVELAVGIVIGAAFTALVNGFVKAFLTPIVGLVSGATGDFSARTFHASGVTFPYGIFIDATISFVIVAAVIYFLVVMPMNRMQEKFFPKATGAPMRECPECLTAIPAAAKRCSACTAPIAPTTVVPQGGPADK
ncbi:large conductance mechanosensitive channel protein MscL [Streptomyces cocklensis]|jgi:large conductance mechanosensitive channel|uniref:Large-conductance mechanosensitive channel n=1 Tax=Actinacidiphila cocklensis TaxID=887465 RepID=A0A9W4GQA6_9ACTN|nr:large conductance mechanosensitive channel protein MscL [Actinacidiphila cocklensis]MDD1059272.1 large conductance mechanosensitive channel protein MscL [Actinacidiphila cocklensis]WSX73222.1 large conductance mechanosensitive channel protein MscL [Streptomyces sp. NBC_00899]WSX80712.1 large conductance mechanosensitive channel protein MscL [Streptomyces sp. NBC_00899]CAG6392474.1 Large-conductance mechanosensitive channel [Actinacidiphila cocklensis]